MSDLVGKTISHYRIIGEVGRGGMGVVYRAEDTKLKRIVALKFLPKTLAVEKAERERFTQEAQAASVLNHPNICTIFEIDEAGDETFFAMEFIEGTTLREWIRKNIAEPAGYRKIRLNEAIELAVQIADGLDKAHEKAIVHRDMKSENVMVTPDRRAKIMDFGLAKLRGVSKLTVAGSTVGTFAYMSPEQVEGLETDHRTDIFSYGVVLYEMLAGRLPFEATHEAALMYEIINVDPPSLTELQPTIGDELNRIVMKCLEKDRDIRYQSMKEVTVDLRRLLRPTEGRRPERSATKIPAAQDRSAKAARTWTAPVAMIIAVGALAIIAALLYLRRGGQTNDTGSQESRITRFTSLPGLEDQPAWSPDGKFLAYMADDRGNFDILVQPVRGGQVIRVANSDADDAEPAWSPDGSKIAFVSARDRGGRFSILFGQGLLETYLSGKGGDIFITPALGGKPVKLVSNGFDPAWSPDGKTIVYRSISGGKWELWSVSSEGGTPKQLTNDQGADYQPSWSPDGRWILYATGNAISYGSGVNQNGHEICVIPAAGGQPHLLTHDGALVLKPSWSRDGNYIFFSSDRKGSMNLWKMRFAPDAAGFETPERVTVGEGDDINVSASMTDDRLAFATVKTSPDIWELTVNSGKLRQVSFETGLEDHPVLSNDGKTLLVLSDRGGRLQLWTMDLTGRFLAQVSSDSVGDPGGYWSPDGSEFAYGRRDGSEEQIVVRSPGEISPRKVIKNARMGYWSPDGTKLAFLRFNATRTKQDLWTHDLATGEERQLTSLEWNCSFPSWSTDGKWIAFNVDKKDTREIWRIPASGGTPSVVLAGESEYSHPMWSPRDHDALLCLKDHKDILELSISSGRVKDLYRFTQSAVNLIDYPTWSPDGEHVYFSLFRKTGDIYILENY